jgi:hypothetical protein
MNLGERFTGDFWLRDDDGFAAGAKVVGCDVAETSDVHGFAAREQRASRAVPAGQGRQARSSNNNSNNAVRKLP